MVVHDIKGQSEFNEKVVEASKSNLVLVDCFATWCGPCKIIAPVLSEWSNEPAFSDVSFIKLDVDESSDVAASLGVRAMPTFMFYKDGNKVNEVVGADPQKLRSMLESLK